MMPSFTTIPSSALGPFENFESTTGTPTPQQLRNPEKAPNAATLWELPQQSSEPASRKLSILRRADQHLIEHPLSRKQSPSVSTTYHTKRYGVPHDEAVRMLRQTLKLRENSGDAAPTPSINSQSK